MNNRKIYFLLTGLLTLSFFFNSCKKEKQTSIPTLFANGEWELGSIIRYKYLGDAQQSVDTIQIKTTQLLSFNKDMTCTYTNFDDVEGNVSGNWSLSDTQLYLFANITYPTVTSDGTKQPFINCKILNLGDFSLVFQTGDIQTYYTATDVRIIRQYGFVKVKPVSTK